MKTKILFALVLLVLAALLVSYNRFLSAESDRNSRIRFQVVTVEEKQGQRNVLSQTTIDGLPGTDFNINLQTKNFKMQAIFTSDLVESDKLKIRAKLNTRRFYGYSQINLPLYEEDAQKQTILVGFDEAIILLPFGRDDDGGAGDGAEILKIEITSTLLTDNSAKSGDELKISFVKPLQSGEISVEAFKIPHNFQVEAALLADGQEIARGVRDVLFDEEQEIALLPNDKAGAGMPSQPLTVKLTVNKYTRNLPQDIIGVGYKLYRDQNQMEIFSGLGGTLVGKDMVYQLNKNVLAGDKNYELKFNIRLAESEQSK